MKEKVAMNRLMIAMGATALVLAACGNAGAPSSTPTDPASSGASIPAAARPASSSPVGAGEPVDLSALPAPYDGANYAAGKRQFAKCRACHLISSDHRHGVGPNLYGVFDRDAGTVEGFRFSEAVSAADFAWSPEKIDQWLTDPKGFLPGNRMTFVGVRNPDERRDLIAFLLFETASGK
jgi:cytochrome c